MSQKDSGAGCAISSEIIVIVVLTGVLSFTA